MGTIKQGFVSRCVNSKSYQEYRSAILEKRRESVRIRRRLLKKSCGTLSKNIDSILMALQRGKCACCKCDMTKTGSHRDHVKPLAIGGNNEDRNIQLLCPKCNHSKQAKNPVDFMQERGYLL